MRRTGQDFPDRYVFREFPDGGKGTAWSGRLSPASSQGEWQYLVTRTGIPPLSGNLLIRQNIFVPVQNGII